MKRRYTALAIISVLYRLSSLLLFVFAVFTIAAPFIVRSTNAYNPYSSLAISSGLVSGVALVLTAIGLYGVGELIDLFRDMELHSRASAENSRIVAEYERQIAYYSKQTANLVYQMMHRSQSLDDTASPPS